jgi:hypothetical protein
LIAADGYSCNERCFAIPAPAIAGRTVCAGPRLSESRRRPDDV